ncbi:hypothetical protein PRIPAC_75806 [Pristionchus pacificus]|uniref:AMP-binding enzyme C-terminal domain-containing protein n=1 Tax=Pristionchus pacificus TaxID=54126 RepID=A0A2A6B5B1_PRIPA|nr:hypothetical protein PRIPAC_74089 [Pristionchus pacificus]KAF8386664.1 hypothetical protein PRIPAC_75806 [Pristionchus pacificus]|eukprot:PDM60998.1 hypothetical protein PRIPAC_54804 [Pristionchus pacificus]
MDTEFPGVVATPLGQFKSKEVSCRKFSFFLVKLQLLTCPIVENICVYGSGLESFTIGLVVPNQKHLEKIAEEVGASGSTEELCANAAVIKAFKKKLDVHATKNKLSRVEQPGAIHLCSEIWTPDSDLLTEALKLKRRPVTQMYEDTIKDLYAKAGLDYES